MRGFSLGRALRSASDSSSGAYGVRQNNVTGGESGVCSDEGEHLLTVTLSEPGDLLLGDDRSTPHSASPPP
ncbi:2OG-Fe dioxygenase family protein [Streptomyces violaceus]|uniref:2OG-Fe dioxygenase family protein n=1 Tax=Streptomyces violaceus TaxID=1936 RepID=A0ABY9UM31_STRVL|nr:2OG-Fe dioxygenase family protein [Streptomyces janthinus]WND21306.1 2OG-Fe dioxygenase family protein [Streptomyces janthinus]GGS46569.1 hypothetical protein GCM10010270_15710 [Streptomyces janthinus]